MKTQAQIIADFSEKICFEDIPSAVIERAKLHLIDILGIGLAASGLEYADSILKTVRSWGGTPQSTVFRYGDRLPMHSAVLANASFTHGLDFDDTHAGSVTHVSSCVVPTALTVGEALKADGKKALTAIVLGYEVMTRIGLAAPGAFHHHGYHPTPICGTFAAGIIAGKLMGLNADALKNTLGICGSQAAGIQAFLDDGSWTKRFHAGWATHSGVIAAQLAENNFFGPKSVLEGRYGLFSTHLGKGNFDPARLTQGLGEEWESLRISFKPYPVCHFSHACMNSAKIIKQEHKIDPEDIAEIEALAPGTIIPIVCEPLAEKQAPQTTYGALFSLPFCIATMLVEDHARLENFKEEALKNSKVLAVAAKVKYKEEPWPDFPKYFSGGVKLTLKDGRTFTHREAINYGHPENPMKTSEVKDKFFANASPVLPRAQLEGIIDVITHLENMPSLEKLAALLVKS